MFFSILSCEEGKNTYMPNVTCWKGVHYFYVVIGILMAIALYCISIFAVQTLIDFGLFQENNVNIKYTTSHDVYSVNIKTYFVLIYSVLKNQDISILWQWGVATLNLLLMGITLIHYMKIKPYLNTSIMKCELVSYLILFWSYLVLFICIILHSTDFNGGIYLFFAGVPFIIAICLTKGNNDFYIKELSTKTKQESQLILRIFTLLTLIKKIKYDREALLLIKGYMYVYEETCMMYRCPLKKLREEVGEDINVNTITFAERLSLFYQHIEIVFKNETKKYPNYLSLRIFYSFFLLKILKKKHCAIEQLEICIKNSYISRNTTLDKEFLIYKLKKFMDNHEEIFLNHNHNKEEIIDTLLFKKEMLNFKGLMKEVNLLYIEFWNILLLSSSENSENLEHLNNIGKKINRGINKINKSFISIQQIKNNDTDILGWYSDFLLNVMNDKRKSFFYKHLLNDILSKENALFSSNEIGEDAFLSNISNIHSSDNDYYILVSSLPESLGIITNLSLGICSMFGYTKKDIVGKKIDILLPEIMIKHHSKLLLEKSSYIKKEIISNEYAPGSYQYKSKEIISFAVTKSKYLIPISLKVRIIYNDNNDFSFVAKLIHTQNAYMYHKGFIGGSSLHYLGDGTLSECYIITNNEFIIQHFTPNAVTLLGLDSHSINGVTDITEYIKEFNEEVLRVYLEKDEKVPQQQQHKLKLHIKQQIQKDKYNNEPTVITWKKRELRENMKITIKNKFTQFKIYHKQHQTMSHLPGYDNNSDMPSTIGDAHSKFCLTVKEERINNTKVGYLFLMETVPDNMFKKVSTLQKGARDRFVSAKIVTHRNKFGNGTENIDKNYVPQAYSKFKLDLNEMSYKCNNLIGNLNSSSYNNNNNKEQSPKNESSIKQMALNKLNIIINKDKKRFIEGEEEYSNQESEEYSDDDDDERGSSSYYSMGDSFASRSSYKSDDIPNIKPTLTNPNFHRLINNVRNKQTVTFNPKDDQEEMYYHVQLDKIKLMVYDFKLNTFIEKNNPRLSQVEIQKISKNNKLNSQNTNKTENVVNVISPEGENRTRKDFNMQSQDIIRNDEYSLDTFLDSITNLSQNDLLLKQIEKSLSKKETQPSILQLARISAVTILSLLFIGIGLIIFGLYMFSHLEENVIVVEKSLDLIFNLILGQFYVKELVLVNNVNYTNYSRDPSILLNDSINRIIPIYEGNNEKLTYLIATFSPLRNASREKIKAPTIQMEYVKRDYTVGTYYVPIYSAYSQVNTALYHITKLNITQITPTQKDLFFYMRNGMNSVFAGIQMYNDIHIKELIYNINTFCLYIIILICGCVVLFIMNFLALIFSYDKVAERKESYLEVFFDIGKNSIEASLESCEFFNKKMQSELNNEKEHETGEDDYSFRIISHNYANETDDVNDNNNNNSNSNSNSGKGMSSRHKLNHKRRERNATRDTKLIKIKIFCALFLLFAFLLCIELLLNSDLKKVSTYVDLFQQFVNLHISNLYLYNFLREYAFDITLPVFNMPAENFSNEINKLYAEFRNKERRVMENINQFPSEFMKLYNDIYETDICNFAEELFKYGSSCDDFLNGAARFGLQSIIISFIEEIRQIKNFFALYEQARQSYSFEYNLTLVGTERENEKWPHGANDTVIEKYILLNPIKLFNLKEFSILNKALIYYLQPSYMALVDKMTECIFSKIKSSTEIDIILISCFIFLSILWFFAYFVPFVNGLSQIIYKTKNMLNIIPKHVLLKIPNITKVLDIVSTTMNKASSPNDNVQKKVTQNYNYSYDLSNNYWS